MYAWDTRIASDDVTASRVLELTLLVVFRTYPSESEAVWTLEDCLVAIFDFDVLTRDANCEQKKTTPGFVIYF